MSGNCKACKNPGCVMRGTNWTPNPAIKCFGYLPQTNYDLLISKTPEELAKIIVDDWCEIVCGSPDGCDRRCEEKTLSWLKSPVEEVEKC